MLGFLTCAMVHSYPYYETFYWFLVIPSIAGNLYIIEKKKQAISESYSKSNGVTIIDYLHG